MGKLSPHLGRGTSIPKKKVLAIARSVLEKEVQALSKAIDQLDESFVKAVKLLLKCRGKVIVIGIGKSGHVGRKIAASLASLGTPAFFVHAAEAVHGDLGMITARDTVILISHSGRTLEITRLLDPIAQIGAPIISITGTRDSPLAQRADVSLITGVTEEADPLNLAPTSSALVTLAIGDAIAVTLAQLKGFTREDFYFFHPGGALGERLARDKRSEIEQEDK